MTLSAVFLWAAGTPKHLIDELPASERVKQAGLGALVCVPSLFAACGAAYVASTTAAGPVAIFLAALVVAVVVFVIDRYFVSSIRTSWTVGRKLVAIAFRLVLTFVLSYNIAHPTSGWFFRDAVDQWLQADLVAKTDATRRKNSPQAAYAQLAELREERRLLERQAFENRELQIYELYGIDDPRASGIEGDGTAYKARKQAADLAEARLTKLDADIERLTRDIEQAQTARTKAVGVTEASHGRGYSARSRALAALRAESPELRRLYWGLFLLIFAFDFLALGAKVFTPSGVYDDRLVLEEEKAAATLDVERHAQRGVHQTRQRRRLLELTLDEEALSTGVRLRKLRLAIQSILRAYDRVDDEIESIYRRAQEVSEPQEQDFLLGLVARLHELKQREANAELDRFGRFDSRTQDKTHTKDSAYTEAA